MPLLYHWRGDNYRRDLDHGVGFHLNQANPLLHEVDPGDSLWAFTRRRDGAYVLAAELVVRAKTMNPAGYRYGPYRVWGDLTRSRYFAADGQPDITTLVRGLSVTAGGDLLGRAFQGRAAVRRLSPNDHRVLAAYAEKLPLEPRARLIPEEKLEALLLAGDEVAVRPRVSSSCIIAFFTTWSWSMTLWVFSMAVSTEERIAAILRCSERGGIGTSMLRTSWRLSPFRALSPVIFRTAI